MTDRTLHKYVLYRHMYATVTSMRTTLVIDDDLYREAKVAAADAHASVSSVVEDALRLLLASRSDRSRGQGIEGMPVNTEMSWVHPGIDIYDGRALRDLLDEGRDISALR